MNPVQFWCFFSADKTDMQLFVRGSELHALEVCPLSGTVGDIRARLAELESLPVDDIVLYSAGKPLEDELILASYTGDLSTLDLELRLLGGMNKYILILI